MGVGEEGQGGGRRWFVVTTDCERESGELGWAGWGWDGIFPPAACCLLLLLLLLLVIKLGQLLSGWRAARDPEAAN